MRTLPLALLILCSACANGPQADLPIIEEARSLAAEWALINQQASERKLTDTYVVAMRTQIREQLQQSSKSLTQPQASYGSEIQALLKEPDDAPAEQLSRHANKLKQIEDVLGSA